MGLGKNMCETSNPTFAMTSRFDHRPVLVMESVRRVSSCSVEELQTEVPKEMLRGVPLDALTNTVSANLHHEFSKFTSVSFRSVLELLLICLLGFCEIGLIAISH